MQTSSMINEISCGRAYIDYMSLGELLAAWRSTRDAMLENLIITTDLPRLMSLFADLARKSFPSAMDFVFYDDRTTG